MTPIRLSAVAAFAIALSVALSSQSPTPVQFDVASVKPAKPGTQPNFGVRPGGRFAAANIGLIRLISMAYQINHEFQIVGGPDWMRTARYDIQAKAPEGAAMGALATSGPPSPVQQMLAALLRDRFGLKAHYETRNMPSYELVPARRDEKLGPNLKRSSPAIDCAALQAAHEIHRPSSPPPPGEVAPCLFLMYQGRVVAGSMPLGILADFLSTQMNRMVVDRTPFTTLFDFDLTWHPDELSASDPFADTRGPVSNTPSANGPSLVTALQEQLGLKLQGTMAPTDVLVIDGVSPPMPD